MQVASCNNEQHALLPACPSAVKARSKLLTRTHACHPCLMCLLLEASNPISRLCLCRLYIAEFRPARAGSAARPGVHPHGSSLPTGQLPRPPTIAAHCHAPRRSVRFHATDNHPQITHHACASVNRMPISCPACWTTSPAAVLSCEVPCTGAQASSPSTARCAWRCWRRRAV
jgi:hypothetical protein